jgi:hypothetical protein
VTGGQRGQTANKKRKISIKKGKTKMKNINPFKQITSLVILGSCLAFSPVGQAQPAFHGNLTIQVEGPITASIGTTGMGGMGGMAMVDTDSTALSDTTLSTNTTLNLSTNSPNAVVTSGTGDFAALKIKHGSAVTLSGGPLAPPSVMSMPGMGSMLMGTTVMFSFAANSGLFVSSELLIFNSPAPNRLHVYAPVLVQDTAAPNYGMAYGELNGYFTIDKKGVITGYFTIYVPQVTW